MAGGAYDFLNFEQKHLKRPEVKIVFILDLSSQNVLEFYLGKDFYI
jgi:hypothetical protein